MRKIILFGIDFMIYTIIFWSITVIEVINNRISVGNAVIQRIALFFVFAFLLCSFRFLFGVYKSIWRYAGVRRYLGFVISDACAGIVGIGIEFAFPILRDSIYFSVSVFGFCCLGTLVSRFIYQVYYAEKQAKSCPPDEQSHKINIAIVGAGNIGASLAAELIRNPQSHYNPLCFIDVDSKKAGLSLNGIPVYKEDDKIVEKIKGLPIHEIIIALPDKDGADKEYLFDLYGKTGCKIKIYDYLECKETQQAQHYVRGLKIEDLLSRDSIHMEHSVAKNYYHNKSVLVTGGGGSIGSELCMQIAEMSPRRLIVFDIYENNAYEIQQELLRIYGNKLDLKVLIGSVRDRQRLEEIFAEYRPDIVIHAAAHKHVPLMEESSEEAVKNNVFGTYYVANMAEKYNVKKFVLISTDKAVNPTGIMGASKRLCEMTLQCRSDSKTDFVAVRFGNVLGSNGSVVPHFQRQIETGGPVTVTDKRIIRYFMTITEAVQLVLEAGAMAQKGEIYVLDMGKPVKIYDLALNMIKLSGLTPGEDIEIKEVGLRPGEKLYEELLISGESMCKTSNSKIFVVKDKPIKRSEIEEKLNLLRESLFLGNRSRRNVIVADALRKCVLEYEPEEMKNVIGEKKASCGSL